ncbi:MAG: hydantoinase B/oxoprolinase family protein [Thermoplasmata archaeon]|nr:hydantoinase B/oxoprolinase family protein [Candidatus Sysuiplasma jiujiangense]
MESFTSEIISSSLMYASEEMGIVLRNSAYSPNIKDRMDHSCALLDREGRLIAQAEHIPVHLGSLPWGLGRTLQHMRREGMQISVGDMIAVNNPYLSGTHLNDITVIRPVFHKGKLAAFAANKAHHSDVGGKVPGSIPFDAEELFQEGFIIDPVKLMKKGRTDVSFIRLLSSNSRDPYQRRGDIRAQIAANLLGETRLRALLEKYGIRSFEEANETAIQRSREITEHRLSEMKDGISGAEDYMELPDGRKVVLRVRLKKKGRRLTADYEGTAEQVRTPLNAVFGVTLSGVYFALRAIAGTDMVTNDGCFSPVDVRVPERSLLNPEFPFPVSAGNTETSMRNVDVLFRAFAGFAPGKVPAACGGSMNNVMIGGVSHGSTWSFYETNGVGSGAYDGGDGVSGIQCNMTNTMNTPAEIVELDYPIEIVRYELRTGSGGAGRWRGGCGIDRAYRALEKMTLTVVAERENTFPYGLEGGEDGKGSEFHLMKNSSPGTWKRVPSKCSIEMEQGDIFLIRTAGGGGYGNANERTLTDRINDERQGLTQAVSPPVRFSENTEIV